MIEHSDVLYKEKMRKGIPAASVIKSCTIGSYPFMVLAGAVLNIFFWYLSDSVIHSPIFLDSVFTAVVAALYGPIPGMITGFLTNLLAEIIYGFPGIHWPFGICNMATGLIVGLMARRDYSFLIGWNVSITIIVVTLVNSLLGTLIAMIVFSGDTEVSLDYIISTLTEFGQSLFAANFWARMITNLIDKMIAVYIAFGVKTFFDKKKV